MGCPDASKPPSCTMWKVALYVLLISLWIATACDAGETCRRWLGGIPVPVAAFLCPEKSDGVDARFCCGTCSRTYCCSSLAARLDQRKCFRDAQLKVPTTDGIPMTPKPDLLYTVLPLALAISLALGCFALVHYDMIKRCAGACRRWQEQIPAVAADLRPVFAPEDRLRRASLDLPPPPYETLALPYSLEDPLRNWHFPPPYPGDALACRHAPCPGVPDGWAVTLFPTGGPSGPPRKPTE